MAARDLTKGPIARSLFLFALPVLGSGVVQQLYSAVDLLFVGNVLGTDAAAALGISSLLVICVTGLFMGLSMGANVVVANLFGARDREGMARAVHAALGFGTVFGLALAFAGFALSEAFIGWMGTPSASVADATVYLRFCFIAVPAIMLYNMLAAIYRALGDAATPLFAQLAGGVLNIACNWLALCVLGAGIAGVATATLASNCLASALLAARMKRLDPGLRFSLGPLGIDLALLRRMLRIGMPFGVQSFAITLSNVFVQGQIDLLGTATIAAFATYLKVELPIYLTIVSMGSAVTAFVAQNNGAGEGERCRKGIRMCQLATIALSAALSAALLLCGHWAFWIFNQDASVVAAGESLIAITFPFYFLYAILEVQGDALRGYGRSIGPSAIVLANICVLRTVLLLVFNAGGATVMGVMATYPITWASTAAMMVAYRLYLARRRPHGAESVPAS